MSRIKNIREKKGISISELSRRSEINASYISKLERGLHSNPSIAIAIKLANALDVNVMELIN